MKQALISSHNNDELYTPSYAIEPLLKHIYIYISLNNPIVWECTDYGQSNITKELKKLGCRVVSTHIKDFDFLNDTPNFDWDIIITNPPYSKKDAFLKKCYEYNKPFALLLPITALEGIERGKMYRQHGLELIVLDKRVSFMDNKKANWFNTSWFCWKLLDKQLNFEELNKEE